MIRIGDKEQFYAQSFIVKDDQEAFFDIQVPTADPKKPLKLGIKFTQQSEDAIEKAPKGGTASWKTDSEGTVRIQFVGWNNALGSAVVEPQKFGQLGPTATGLIRKVYFQIAQWKIGSDLNVVHLHLFLEVPSAS